MTDEHDALIKKDYSGWDEKIWEVQAKGICGERQNNGKRCTNKITEWFNLDPDRPGAILVGACGVHVKDVGPRVKRHIEDRSNRSLEKWEEAETYRIARAFKALGFQMKLNLGYRSKTPTFSIENPGQFIATLESLGVPERLGLDLNLEECGVHHPQYDYRFCREAKGHEDDHDDWYHYKWKDPEPVVPEPEVVSEEVKTVSSDGGSFS